MCSRYHGQKCNKFSMQIWTRILKPHSKKRTLTPSAPHRFSKVDLKFWISVEHAKPCLNLNYSKVLTPSPVRYKALVEHNTLCGTMWICPGYPPLTHREVPENATICQNQHIRRHCAHDMKEIGV